MATLPATALQAMPSEAAARVAEALADALAPTTVRTYQAVWRGFQAWADEHGFTPLPAAPEVVAMYLTDRAGKSHSWRATTLCAIKQAHEWAGHSTPGAHPAVATVLRGLRRKAARAGQQGTRQATGLTAAMVGAIRATACRPRATTTGRTETAAAAQRRGKVDIALVCLMRDALLRRSEAAALVWEDLQVVADGTGRLTVRRSKTDQDAHGQVLYVSRVTAVALQDVRMGADGDMSILGMSSRTIARRIAAAARHAGLEGRFTGHSPRVGMASDLAAMGISLVELQTAGRWKSSSMPAHYTRAQRAGKGAVARYYAAQAAEAAK